MNSIIKQMQKLTNAMKRLEMNEMEQMKLHDHDAYNDDHIIKNEPVFYDVEATECDICMTEYFDDGVTCSQCKKNICIQCYSKIDKCAFCRKSYEKEPVQVTHTNNEDEWRPVTNESSFRFHSAWFPEEWAITYNIRVLREVYMRQHSLQMTRAEQESCQSMIRRGHYLYTREMNRISRLTQANQPITQARRPVLTEPTILQNANALNRCTYCHRDFKNKSACTNHTRHHCSRRPNQ